jgi:Rieske 2Fe-2S family protein
VRLEKSLPSYYLPEEIYQREKEVVFCGEWFCAGREEDLPSPGRLLVLEVVGENILVLASTRSGELKALIMYAASGSAAACGRGAM